ncbi:MAG: zinc-ribbon domain-containing protein [Lacisediminihabitans sp.]
MEKCTNCQAELDPAWKFCITCGTPAPTATRSQQALGEHEGDVDGSGKHDEVVVDDLSRDELSPDGPRDVPSNASDGVLSGSSASLPDAVAPGGSDDVSDEAPADAPSEIPAEVPVEGHDEATDKPKQTADDAPALHDAPAEHATQTPAAETPPIQSLHDANDVQHPAPLSPRSDASRSGAPQNTSSQSGASLSDSPTTATGPPFQLPDIQPIPPKPQTRAEAKAAAEERAAIRAEAAKTKAAETKATIARHSTSSRANIPAAIRNTPDGPLVPEMSRRTVNVSLIVSLSLGIAGAALIVYLVILVFGSRG